MGQSSVMSDALFGRYHLVRYRATATFVADRKHLRMSRIVLCNSLSPYS